MNRKALFGFIFLQILLLVAAKSFYTVVAPHTLKSGTDYSVTVTLHYNDEPSVVKVGIYGPSLNSTKTLDMPPYNIAVAHFDIPKLVNGTYKLKVQGVKGMIFRNTTDLRCDWEEDIIEDMEQIMEMKTQPFKNSTLKRLGPLNLNYKRENRRIARDVAIEVRCNETIPYMVYALVVKGKIHSQKLLELDGNETLEYITLSPTYDMYPHAYLYVYFILNETLVWRDLSIFFIPKDKDGNDTIIDLPEGTEHILEDDVTDKKNPGEISGLVTMTNAINPPRDGKFLYNFKSASITLIGLIVDAEIAVHLAVLLVCVSNSAATLRYRV